MFSSKIAMASLEAALALTPLARAAAGGGDLAALQIHGLSNQTAVRPQFQPVSILPTFDIGG